MEHSEYRDFVRMVARNNLDRDGSGPRSVAESAIVDTENVGDEKTLLFSLEPYADDPRTQTKLWPGDVLTGAGRAPYHASQPDDLRELAVEVLTADLYSAMLQIENTVLRTATQPDRADQVENSTP